MSTFRRILLFPLTRLAIALVLLTFLLLPLVPISILVRFANVRDEAALELGLEVWFAAIGVGTLGIVAGAIELRPPSAWGFPASGMGRDLAAGFGVGALVFSLVVVVMAAPGWYRATGLNLTGSVGAQLAYFLVLFFVVAVFEEVLMRGLLFRILEEGIGTWGALAVSSLVFGLLHNGNPGATAWSGLAIAAGAGPLLAGGYILFRNLWAPIGIHWAWNLFEGPIYGGDVSGLKTGALIQAHIHGPSLWTGTSFGPEDGLASVSVALMAAIVLLVIAVRRSRIVSPGWMIGLLRLRAAAADPASGPEPG